MANPVHLSSSRVVPVPLERTFDEVLPAPLPTIFSRRFGLLPPIKEVRDQEGSWGAGLGQSRTIATSDGGTMKETLTTLERPQRFGYTLSDISGPMRPLVGSVEGMWSFEPAGTGTRITWSWVLHPTNGMTALAMPLFARMWRGYARQGLEDIEKVLVGS